MKQYLNLIVFFILTITLITILLVLGFDGLYGQDAYEYLRYTKAFVSFFKNGEDPGDYFWPVYYPLIGSIFSLLLKNEVFVLQLISVTSIGICLVYLKKIISLVYDTKNYIFIYVILFFAGAPYVFKVGVSIMSDMLATCFIVLTFYQGILYTKEKHIKHLYIAAIFAISAIMTRYASGVVICPLFIYLLPKFFKHKHFYFHLLPIVFIIGILSYPHLYIRSNNATEFLNHNWITSWSFKHLFLSEFTTPDGFQSYTTPNIVYSFYNLFHPSYFFLGLPLLVFIKKEIFKSTWIRLFVISIAVYAIFLAGIPFQNKRFLLLSFPLILIICYPVFLKAIFLLKTPIYQYLCIVTILFIQISLIYFSFKPIIKRVTLEKELFALMSPYQNNTLYSFDIDIALQGRGLLFDYKNMFLDLYTNFEKDDLILFNYKKFEQQWNNKNPMINWDYANKHYNLTLINSLDNGWELYKIVNDKN